MSTQDGNLLVDEDGTETGDAAPSATPVPEQPAAEALESATEASPASAGPATATQEPEPASSQPLVRYLDGLVAILRTRVAEVCSAGSEDGVHQARVATRRLKAAIDLLRPIVSERARGRFNRALRRVRRRLGPVRDLDVMSGHLTEMTDPGGSVYTAAAAAWLRGQFGAERARRAARASSDKALARLDGRLAPWSKLRRQIERHAEAIDTLLAESLHAQLEAFAASAVALDAPAAGEAGSAPEAGSEPATAHAADPHEVRIAGKALRYTVEMAQQQGHALPDDLNKQFKRMQDALGNWHDHVVLTERAMVESAAAMLAHHRPALQHGILDVAGAALRRADDELARFRRLWGEHGERLAGAIREAFPLSRPVDPPANGTPPAAPEKPVEATVNVATAEAAVRKRRSKRSRTDRGPAGSA